MMVATCECDTIEKLYYLAGLRQLVCTVVWTNHSHLPPLVLGVSAPSYILFAKAKQ